MEKCKEKVTSLFSLQLTRNSIPTIIYYINLSIVKLIVLLNDLSVRSRWIFTCLGNLLKSQFYSAVATMKQTFSSRSLKSMS